MKTPKSQGIRGPCRLGAIDDGRVLIYIQDNMPLPQMLRLAP